MKKLLALALLCVSIAVHAAITVVQVGSVGQFNGTSLSAQSVLSGVTAGNTIIDCVNHVDFGGTNPTFSVTDGTSHTSDESFQQSGISFSGVFRLSSAGAGTHTTAATASSGTTGNSFGSVVSIEVSGLASSPVDQATVGHSTGAGSTTPTVGPTAALSQANELLVACYQANGTPTGITWPPTGGPGSFTTISGVSNDGASAQQIQASGTSAVTVSAGTTANVIWVMPLVTYKAGTSGSTPGMMMRGTGKNTPAANEDHLLLAAAH